MFPWDINPLTMCSNIIKPLNLIYIVLLSFKVFGDFISVCFLLYQKQHNLYLSLER